MPIQRLLRERTQTLAASLLSHRILLYFVASTLALFAAIANALKNFSNFYSVAIYLSKSSRSVLVLANFGFLVSLFSAHVVQRLFFGTLRANEVERLYDRLWFFVTESLLAFTIFREEFDIGFVLMFGALLFTKSFHWLAADRLEWMDQRPYPGPPLLFHARMCILFVVLWSVDMIMFLIALDNTLAYGVGGMVLFASEYGILMASVANCVSKYSLSAYEFYRAGQRGGENAPPWENKSMWVFYVELMTDFLKLTIYLVFFTIIITFYGLPLNIVRDVYITARSFISRIRALRRYQAATRNMDERYPNATEEEMAIMTDHTCIICREEMSLRHEQAAQAPIPSEGPNTTPKKLPCGHIFHFHCLRSWLERQQSCPTCRRTVLEDGGTQPATPPNHGVPEVRQNAQPQPPAGGENAVPAARGAPAGNPGVPVGHLLRAQAAQGQAPGTVPVAPQGPNTPAQTAVVIQYQIQFQPQPPELPRTQPVPNGQPQPPFLRQIHPNPAYDLVVNHPPDSSNGAVSGQQSSPGTSTPTQAAAQAALQRLSNGKNVSAMSSPSQPPTARDDAPHTIPLQTFDQSTWGDAIPQSSITPRSSILGSDGALAPLQFPPTLTEHQLSVLDHLTREAIDERLRVLERVSSTIYQSIEDLMRVRSALPSDPVSTSSESDEVQRSDLV